MRIGIDARMMGKGFGIGRYIEQLLLHLEMQDHENEYHIFLSTKNWNLFEPKNKNFIKVLSDVPWYSWQEQIFFPHQIKKEMVDIMHFPHFNVPLLYRGPFIITLHDLIMFHFKRQEASTHGPLVYWCKDKMHRFILKNAAKRAKHILVTSEFTKHDVSSTLSLPNEKMTVTYQAPFDKNDLEMATLPIDVLKKYNIVNPYILYVGAAYPHKNLEMLLKAWKIFEKKQETPYQLILVGKENFFYTRLKNTILQNMPSVSYVGCVSDDELSLLYTQAKFFIFPSLYEGFGLPPLEAMMHGLAVLSSNASCLPEVLKDAALYFDPKDAENIASVIREGLLDPQIRLLLAKNAQKLLPRYSWGGLAKQTRDCYTRGY